MANQSIFAAFERMWQNVVNLTGTKMSATDPVGTGSLSMNRKAGTTVGMNSVTEGANNTASNGYTHAEGYNTTASAMYAHSEGNSTLATGKAAHAEGWGSEAKGDYSHAEGYDTLANTTYTHAEGLGTIAASVNQHVEGKYNEADYDNMYAHIVGGGSGDSDRFNIYTLDWDGAAWYSGEVDSQVGLYKVAGNQAVYFSGSQEVFGSNNWPTQIAGKTITSTKSITTSSDERLKNIFDIDIEVLKEFVSRVNLVGYTYKEYPNDKCIGVVAQQLIEINPEIAEYFVRENADGYYSVDYAALTFAMAFCALQK